MSVKASATVSVTTKHSTATVTLGRRQPSRSTRPCPAEGILKKKNKEQDKVEIVENKKGVSSSHPVPKPDCPKRTAKFAKQIVSTTSTSTSERVLKLLWSCREKKREADESVRTNEMKLELSMNGEIRKSLKDDLLLQKCKSALYSETISMLEAAKNQMRGFPEDKVDSEDYKKIADDAMTQHGRSLLIINDKKAVIAEGQKRLSQGVLVL